MSRATPEIIRIDSAEAFQRGLSRGITIADTLKQGIAIYLEFFEASGVGLAEVQKHGEHAVLATERWSSPPPKHQRCWRRLTFFDQLP